MGKLVNMKMTEKESKELNSEIPTQPRFPFGLNVRLDEESIKKLGLTDLPKAGDKRILMAKVNVDNVSVNEDSERGLNRSMSLQITDMGIEEDKDKKSNSQVFFGDK